MDALASSNGVCLSISGCKVGTDAEIPSPDLDRPLICPGKILHTRIYPGYHSFTYSYLMVWIPIHSELGGNRILSIDNGNHRSPGWLQVLAKDHLHREDNGLGLKSKLDAYLKTQNIELFDFPYIYLVTAPRVLNHKFSPASFWFLYTADRALKVVIAEVNNTFDERRMYIRFAHSGIKDAASKYQGIGGIADFQSFWPKDFHVSPFSSRKGFYHLSVRDPLAHRPASDGDALAHARIDIRPVLHSSKGHKKLVTRLWSVGEPLDPAAMSSTRFAAFLISWWWIGLVTYPRILYQAIQLAHRRGLSIWYRPEPTAATVPRWASTAEMSMAEVFSKYLCAVLLKHKGVSLQSRKATNGTSEHSFLVPENATLSSPAAQNQTVPGATFTLTISITTPEFYTRFASYSSLEAFLHNEILHPGPRENQAILVSSPEIFAALIRGATATPKLLDSHKARENFSLPVLEQLEWLVVGFLRVTKPVRAGWYPEPGNPHLRAHQSTWSQQVPEHSPARDPAGAGPHWSFLDEYMQHNGNEQERRAYLRATMRMCAVRRLELGVDWFLRWFGSILRFAIVAVIMWHCGFQLWNVLNLQLQT